MPDIALRGGHVTFDPRLDRLPQYDSASREYQVRERRLARLGATIRRKRGISWTCGPTLDQGREGACVGFGTTHRRNAAPRRHNFQADVAQRFYKRAQFLDQWPGEAYEGTSVLAGMKVAQEMGWTSGYSWTGAGSGRLEDDVVDTLGWVGPIIAGTPWLHSMMATPPSGLLAVDRTEPVDRAGHCYLVFGQLFKMSLENKTRPVVLIQNSWGETDFGTTIRGVPGSAYMLLDDFLWLLENGGEGAVPAEL